MGWAFDLTALHVDVHIDTRRANGIGPTRLAVGLSALLGQKRR